MRAASGTDLPAISIEVDDLAETEAAVRKAGAEVVYGPTTEPWGVRRFFLRDPAGTLVNVLSPYLRTSDALHARPTTTPTISPTAAISGRRQPRWRRCSRCWGCGSLDDLIGQTMPAGFRQAEPLEFGAPLSERDLLWHMRQVAKKNKVFTTMIGQGFHGTVTPPAIQRNILENPAWYTAYTPYQPEISPGPAGGAAELSRRWSAT